MQELNYHELGLKCGLEIHQQLDTNKLFCSCPSLLRSDEPDFIIRRKLHAVAGESGEVDAAAKHEVALDKEFEYQGYDTICLVELDEEPPHEMNKEALRTALHIALLLNMTIIPTTQIMRKTVVDGSNTSGFQRTMLIARNGYVDSSHGRVGIEALFLEEDSARPVSREKGKVIYRLDRLGIPLVEIATAPDIKTPEQAKEVALQIGDILRSCKVRRGIGTIRQDINISIAGSNRVELKGFQDPKLMIKTVEMEVQRQLDFISKNKKNPEEVRNVLTDGSSEFLRPMPGEARMYPETDLPILKIHRDFINETKKTLPKLRSDIEDELSKIGLNHEMIKILMKQNKVEEFKHLLKIVDNPSLIAKIILIFPKEIAKKKNIKLEEVESRIEDSISDVLALVEKKEISESHIKGILEKIVSGEKLSDMKHEKHDIGDIEEKIHKIIKSKTGLSQNAYMGLVMKELKGKVDGKEAMEIIRKFVK